MRRPFRCCRDRTEHVPVSHSDKASRVGLLQHYDATRNPAAQIFDQDGGSPMVYQKGHEYRTHEIYRSRLPLLLVLLGVGAVWTANVYSRANIVRSGTQIATIADIVNYYGENGDHMEVLRITEPVWEEVRRQGIPFDEPSILRLTHQTTLALFELGYQKEALEVIESAYGACIAALEDFISKGIDRQEILQDYPDRNSEVQPDVSLKDYAQSQFRRKAIFEILFELEALKAHMLSTSEEEEQSLNVLAKLIVQIERDMSQITRAPNFPGKRGSLSKVEILKFLDSFRAVQFSRDPGRGIPLSQRILAFLESAELERSACATMDQMRVLTINLSGTAVDLEIRDGSRPAVARRL